MYFNFLRTQLSWERTLSTFSLLYLSEGTTPSTSKNQGIDLGPWHLDKDQWIMKPRMPGLQDKSWKKWKGFKPVSHTKFTRAGEIDTWMKLQKFGGRFFEVRGNFEKEEFLKKLKAEVRPFFTYWCRMRIKTDINNSIFMNQTINTREESANSISKTKEK